MKNGISRSHLFLIELIIVTLFFAFAGAIAVQVFSKAHDLAAQSTALNGAVTVAQSAAETDKATAFADIARETRIMHFNNDWQTATPEQASYVLAVTTSLEEREAGTMVSYIYSITSNDDTQGNTIYSLTSKKYYPGRFLDENLFAAVN